MGTDGVIAPGNLPPKAVNFQLILSEGHNQQQARLPLRVNVRMHDTTDSIISTVKSFYGLYHDQGVAFEDSAGASLIARYENFENNSIVRVRVTGMQAAAVEGDGPREAVSPAKPKLQEPFQMLPPGHERSTSRSARKRSVSPASEMARRAGLARAPSNTKSLSVWTDLNGDLDAQHGQSDNESMSVSSSRRGRDNVASADISTDNIVEGGRRKRAKFESSELPLFQPPTFPRNPSMSSASPQRRQVHGNGASPLIYNSANILAAHPLLSPQSFGHSESALSLSAVAHGRTYNSTRASTNRPVRLSAGSNSGILPTPAPTVGSMISDEDVAYQLMRLGEAPGFPHGRMSASTGDDALSGKAEAASSDEFSDVASDDEPPSNLDTQDARRQMDSEAGLRHVTSSLVDLDSVKQQYAASHKTRKVSGTDIPPSPYLASQGHRISVSSDHFHSQATGDEDEDLSSKPRCQRCRKSKKGCDRQRPCQRCKDAGIGIEGCVSEEEGNGRKGRYGRHMGVTVKKAELTGMSPPSGHFDSGVDSMLDEALAVDKNIKKRKR